VDGIWGLPGTVAPDASAPVAVVQTGTITGELDASVVSAGTIAGTMGWVSNISSNGSGVCQGTFSATLQP
jgi:hypothetical protein